MEDGLHCLHKELTKSSKQYMWRFLLRKEKKKNETARTSFIGEYVGEPLALVHRAVADAAAQHHAEDHLKDLWSTSGDWLAYLSNKAVCFRKYTYHTSVIVMLNLVCFIIAFLVITI